MKIFIRTTRARESHKHTKHHSQSSVALQIFKSVTRREASTSQSEKFSKTCLFSLFCCLSFFQKLHLQKLPNALVLLIITSSSSSSGERERESESERESQRESERKTERKTERKRENAAEEIGRKIICWRKKTREKRERSGEERAGEIDDDDDFGVEKGEDYGKECGEKEGE